MTETPAAFLLAATLAALCQPGMAGTGPGRPGLWAGRAVPAERARGSRADDPGRACWSNRADAASRLMRGGLLALTIVIVLSPWMIRNCSGLRRARLDDDPWRLHPGAGQQPRLLRRRLERAAGPGLDRPRPVALVGFGQPRDHRHVRTRRPIAT